MTQAQTKALAAIRQNAARYGATVEVDTYRSDLWCTVGRPSDTRAMLLVVKPSGEVIRDC